MQDFIHVAVRVAKEAGAYQLDRLGKANQIEFKGEINLVTEVDKACEKLITDAISAAFSDHDILAEEGGGKRRDSEYKWIIDPLDGTTNYAHGYPLFCVSIALEYKGEIVMGVVYEPNRDELFIAEKNQGATLNDQKISVSRNKTLQESLLVTGFAYNIRETKNNNLNHFENMLMKARAVRRDGVAAVDLCYVACGRYDGFWELNLFPWDVGAGYLLIQEAGGRVTNFKGDPFSVYAKDILATNGMIHDEMIQVLKK